MILTFMKLGPDPGAFLEYCWMTIVNDIYQFNIFIPFSPFSHCSTGFNVDEAKKILKESGLPIQTADDMDTAAQKAVASLQ